MVIVVDEPGALRARMAAALRDDGHEVMELGDGAQLLARLMSLVALFGRRRESIAIVASVDASVFGVLRMLRAARWRTPVILVASETGRAPERDVGAVAMLRRPVDPRRLCEVVAEAVRPRAAAAPAARVR
jgi:DNA-binding response OmpR family regulator